MLFLIIVEVHDLEHIFPNSAFSAGGRGKASVFLILVLLLILTSMFFLLSLSLLIKGLAACGGRGVGQFKCQKQRGFFDKVVVEILGGEGLRLGYIRVG